MPLAPLPQREGDHIQLPSLTGQGHGKGDFSGAGRENSSADLIWEALTLFLPAPHVLDSPKLLLVAGSIIRLHIPITFPEFLRKYFVFTWSQRWSDFIIWMKLLLSLGKHLFLSFLGGCFISLQSFSRQGSPAAVEVLPGHFQEERPSKNQTLLPPRTSSEIFQTHLPYPSTWTPWISHQIKKKWIGVTLPS